MFQSRPFSILLNLFLVVTLIIPVTLISTYIAPVMAESKPVESTGLYRAWITLVNPTSLERLEQLGIPVLEERETEALILATSDQLETLARLRFQPVNIDDLGLLNDNNASTKPWLAQSMQPTLQEASQIWEQVETLQREQWELSQKSESENIAHLQNTEIALDALHDGLSTLLHSLTNEQLAAITVLTNIDSDGDGLTDTEEFWWCTNPLNPDTKGDGVNDGQAVANLLAWMNNEVSGPPVSGTPFAGWPMVPDDGQFNPNCIDQDQDSVPDHAERWVLGLNPNRESTSRDKFDDGQKLFGITKWGWGALPRVEDSGIIFAEMPSWVLHPGKHPLVAAFPVIEVSVEPSSWTVERVTTITTQQGEMTQLTHSYETSVTQGQSTSNSDTVTWNEWEELSQSMETPVYANLSAPMGVPVVVLVRIAALAVSTFGGRNSNKANTADWISAGSGAVSAGSSAVSAYYDYKTYNHMVNDETPKQQLAALESLSKHTANIAQGQTTTNEHLGDINTTLGTSLDGIHYAIDAQGQLLANALYDISYQLSRPRYTETRTQGSSWGGSQTTTHEVYEEHTISEGEAFTTGQNWSTAWAVDSSHAADLTFVYTIKNTGTEYAREVTGLIFNVYIGDDTLPSISYPAWQQFSNGKLQNLFPSGPNTPPGMGNEHTFASNTIPLSLEQMKRIDLGERLRITVESYSYGVDQLFYADALNNGITVYIEDGVADGDETVDMYLIPTWGNESVSDVLTRYFPYGEDENGELNALWTPEFHGNNTLSWHEHFLSNISWWNIYFTQAADDYRSLDQLPAETGSNLLFRFDRDSDWDGYSDRAEFRYYCSLPENNPEYIYCADAHSRTDIHPQTGLLAGHVLQDEAVGVGDTATVMLVLENTGNSDAYSIGATMFSPDDTTTIEWGHIGGNGRIRPGSHVAVGSMIKQPDLSNWGNSTAKPYAAGNYTGMENRTYTVTVQTSGVVGQSGAVLLWNSGIISGTMDLGAAYQAPLPVDLADGIQIGLNSGTVSLGAKFTIQAIAPLDTLAYTINSEPYTPPVIIVSYTDPKGNHSFITPVRLPNLEAPLAPHSSELIKGLDLQLVTTAEIDAVGFNNMHMVVNNSLPIAIEGGYLHWHFVSDGEVVLQKTQALDIPPGPTIYQDQWSVNDFSVGYNPDGDNLILVFWTDSEDNIIDATGRTFYGFQNDPVPTFAISDPDSVLDLGSIVQGTLVQYNFAVANTGSNSLGLYPSIPDEIELSHSGYTSVSAGDFVTYQALLDTGKLQTGAYNQVISLRTSDPKQPEYLIQVVGEILPVTGDAHPQTIDFTQPWDESLFIPGPNSAEALINYAPAEAISSDLEPLAVYDLDGNLLGIGEYGDDVLATTRSISQESTPNGFSGSSVPTNESTVQNISDLYTTNGLVIPPDFLSNTDNKGYSLTDAVELTEYRTASSRVYLWPDGTGLAFSSLGLLDSEIPLPQAVNATCGSVGDGYIHWYYSGNYPQFGEVRLYIGNFLGFYKQQARSYIQFCLPGLPQYHSVSDASMWLYMYSPNGTNTIGTYLYQVTSSWSEGAPFHGTAQPGLSGPIDSRNQDKNVGWKGWALTGLAQSWYSGQSPNYGVMLAANPENANGMAFYSRENGSNVPYLSVSFTLNPPASVPSLNAVNNPGGEPNFQVSWGSVANTTSYELQESYNGGGWITIQNNSANTYGASNKSSGTWSYRVRAQNSVGSGPWSVTQSTLVRPTTSPTLNAIVNVEEEPNYQVAWGTVANATTYELQEGHNGGSWSTIQNGSSRTYQALEKPDGTWSYRVRALNSAGSGPWSVTQSTVVQSYIIRRDGNNIELKLPEDIANHARYTVQYGQRGDVTGQSPNVLLDFSTALPKQNYSALALDLFFRELDNSSFSFGLDIGANGSVEWSGNGASYPAVISSANATALTAALNNYLSATPAAWGELVTIPIRLNMNQAGEVFLTNVVAVSGTNGDVEIDAGDISFNDNEPVEMDSVTVDVVVHNPTSAPVANVMVTLFDDDPANGGVYLGSDSLSDVTANSSKQAEIVWDTTGYTGNVNLSVVLDATDHLPETNESNNHASKAITVKTRPDLQVAAINLSNPEPVVGETITVTLVALNSGQAHAPLSTASLYEGNPQTDGLLIAEALISVPGEEQTDITFAWTPDAPGPYRLFAVVDRDNVVNESDKTNNIDWLDVYVGFAGPLLVNSGTTNDVAYTPAAGYGFVDEGRSDIIISCPSGDETESSLRLDPDGHVLYRFDHLLPGHFYHLDIVLRECDAAGRQQHITVNGIQITDSIDLSDGGTQKLSLLLDPAFYGQHTIEVAIESPGIDGAVVSAVNLHDIDYRYADAGGTHDPQYPGPKQYGWQNGVAQTVWGVLPYQTVRVNQTGSTISYRFDRLDASRQYDVNLTFWQPSGTARVQKIQIDGVDVDLTVDSGDYQIHRESVAVPINAYATDGSIVVSMVRLNATSGAMVNEIALEENTLLITPNSAPFVPDNPTPADGAENQPALLLLSWAGGDPDAGNSIVYDVYMDADNPTPTTLVCADISATPCDPGALADDETYYWYVTATDNHGLTSTGPVWSFTTASSAACALTWQVGIGITDNGSSANSLFIGQGPTATDELDIDCGEAMLPPSPPVGSFDARLTLPGGTVDSLSDVRSDAQSHINWQIKFQPSNDGYPFTLTWDPTDLPSGSLRLKDMFGGMIVNVDMRTQSSYVLSSTGINQLQIEYDRCSTLWTAGIGVSDNGSGVNTLTIGQAPSATDGLDSYCGEVMLPPSPPAGSFDTRLTLPGGTIDSLTDLRSDTHLEADWQLKFQPSGGGYPFTFTWNPDDLPEGSVRLKDMFSGMVVNVDMKTQNSYTLANVGVTQLKIEYRLNVCLDVNLAAGWNMVSVPVQADNMQLTSLFPDVSIPVYYYTNAYQSVQSGDMLETGRGYWMYFTGVQSYEICGQSPASHDIPVNAGWNMIGPFDISVAIGNIGSTPTGILNPPLYEYNNGYAQDDTLDPSKGYWTYVNQTGVLHLGNGITSRSGSMPTTPSANRLNQPNDFRLPINISNGESNVIVRLGVSSGGGDGYDPSLDWLAPPMPPTGVFDARLTGADFDYLMDVRGPGREMQTFVLQYSGGDQSSPVTLSWDPNELSALGTFEIVDLLGGDLVRLDMSANGELVVEPGSVLANGLAIRFTASSPINNHPIYLPVVSR